jgi:predicted Co/Zn/Cd cation transporter (cation efflux family)
MVAEDLSIGVLYYFRITPRTTTASWNRSTIIPMSTSYMPTITSLVTNVLSTSSVSLTWDGSYSLVNIVASTDSLFADVFIAWTV